MKVAICHDYLYQFGGAEKCVEAWLEMYPKADVYTSFSVADKFKSSNAISLAFKEGRVKNSLLNKLFKLRFLLKFYKHFVPIYSIFTSLMRVKDYDLVIVSATFCGKNMVPINAKKIIFYCYTPTRFLYGYHTELDRSTINPFFRALLPIINQYLRILDQKAVKRLIKQKAIFVGISNYIRDNIQKFYHTESRLIYPPVEINKYLNLNRQYPSEDYYIYFGRISFHKRVDLAIQACLNLDKNLYVIGPASFQPEIDKLKKMVADYKKEFPQNKSKIVFTGRVSDEDLKKYFQKAKAMIFTPKEDFGIAPVEAMSAGCPVIAYKAGGALEYIIENKNGIFFENQNVESLVQAIERFENAGKFDEKQIKKSTIHFDKEAFFEKFQNLAND